MWIVGNKRDKFVHLIDELLNGRRRDNSCGWSIQVTANVEHNRPSGAQTKYPQRRNVVLVAKTNVTAFDVLFNQITFISEQSHMNSTPDITCEYCNVPQK